MPSHHNLRQRQQDRRPRRPASKQPLTKLPKSKLALPVGEVFQRRVRKQHSRTKVACTYCRRRKLKCEPIYTSKRSEPAQITCGQCESKGEECSRSKNLRPGSIPLCYRQPIGFADLPKILPRAPPIDNWFSEMSDQQPKSIITQSQHVEESLPAPLSSAILEVDDLLGYPEVNGRCLATNERVNSEASVAENPMMKQEQTESGSIGLGIHIPEDHPQSLEAVGSLFRPIDTGLAKAQEPNIPIRY
ncbi:MAG: hypothetical protein Q9192_006691 [Flavoplaca navasiana]